jgi:hypothetical protein
MEIIATIAALCQLNTGADGTSLLELIQKKQLQCQQYYVKCLDNPVNRNYKTLSKCIVDKK